MTHAYALHGEVAGRRGGYGGSRAERFGAHTDYGGSGAQPEYATSPVRSNIAGNGGKYSLSWTNYSGFYFPYQTPHTPARSYRESLHRISVHSTRGGNRYRTKFYLMSPFNDDGRPYWMLNFYDNRLEVYTLANTSSTRRSQTYVLTTNQWQDVWIYARLSTTIEGAGGTQNADGRIRVWIVDPRTTGANPVCDFTGIISYSNNGNVDGTPNSPVRFHLQQRDEYIDDCVGHIPSMSFVSSTSSLPAYNDVIKYTDGSGNVITAIVTNAHQTGTDGSGNAKGLLTLTHMIYTPSGGSAVDFNGLDWGGVTQPWGTGSVSITDSAGNALGTGTFDYRRSTLPRNGVFMPVAKPVTSTTTMTPNSGTAAESHLRIDDFGGGLYPGQYIYADATGQYWTGDFDDDTVAGDAKLVVAGNPDVTRVLSYVFGKHEGTGSAVSGIVTHYNVVTGNPISTRASTIPHALSAGYVVSVFEHPECATGVAGTTTPWTVANLNAASFGVTVE